MSRWKSGVAHFLNPTEHLWWLNLSFRVHLWEDLEGKGGLISLLTLSAEEH